MRFWVRGHVTDEHNAAAMKGVENKEDSLKVKNIKIKGFGGAKTKLWVEIDERKIDIPADFLGH